MTEGTIGIILLVFITALVSWLIHRRTTNFWLGCLASTVVSVVVFQIVAYVHLGHLDPFILIAIPVSALVSFMVSIFVGKVAQTYLRKTKQ